MINVLAAKFNQVDASITDTSVSNRRAPNQTKRASRLPPAVAISRASV